MKKVGRPPIEGEIKVTRSIRLKPSVRKAIEDKHERIQRWIDKKIEEEFGEVYETEVVYKTAKGKKLATKSDFEEISEEDF